MNSILRGFLALAATAVLGPAGAIAQPGADLPSSVPFAQMQGVPLTQSVARLISEDWQVVGVSLRERTFVYHLVRRGQLAICLTEFLAFPLGSECVRMDDGPAPALRTTAPGPQRAP